MRTVLPYVLWMLGAGLMVGLSSARALSCDLAAGGSLMGESEEDRTGAAVAGVGDVNGDNYDDFLVAACGSDQGGPQAGQTYLMLGASSGWSADVPVASLAAASFVGDASETSGWSVAGVGDVNGDGSGDFLIGAPGYDEGGLADVGRACLILGATALPWGIHTPLSSSALLFIGDASGERAGCSVAGAGDVNGDGYSDVLIGAPGSDSSAGRTYLVLGRAGWDSDRYLLRGDRNASFQGEYPGDRSGHCVAAAGDANGDGYDDFLIGAPSDDGQAPGAGKTYLVFGAPSGWTSDFALGSLVENSTPAGVSFAGSAAFGRSGFSLAGVGDFSGDGYDDLLIGAPGYDNERGSVYLILGASTAKQWGTVNLEELGSRGRPRGATFLGELSDDRAGSSVSSAGDFNGDGYNDFLLAAEGFDGEQGVDAGKVYLIHGSRLGASRARQFNLGDLSRTSTPQGCCFLGTTRGNRISLACAGDLDGDGLHDFLVGEPHGESFGTATGKTHLLFGRGAAAQATYRAYMRSSSPSGLAGGLSSKGIGTPGDRSGSTPASRCWLTYAGGHGPGGTGASSLETVTLMRHRTGEFSEDRQQQEANVHWTLFTNRTGWEGAWVTLKYTDEEIFKGTAQQLDEDRLSIYQRGPLEPYRPLSTIVDADRNLLRAPISPFPYSSFAISYGPRESNVVINEFVARNGPRSNGKDWIEFYNRGNSEIGLAGWTLEANVEVDGSQELPDVLQTWTFPSIGATVPAGGYLVIWAPGRGIPPEMGFPLRGGGGYIALYDATGNPVDAITYTEQQQDVAYGRFPDGSGDWRFLYHLTRGGRNKHYPPQFDLPAGVYSASQTLRLSTAEPGAAIYYTTDSSPPTKASTRYTSGTPISVTETMAVRARAYESEHSENYSEMVTHSYLIGAASVPIFSIVANPPHLWDATAGIYTHPQEKDWERPVWVEFFDASGRLCFAGEAAIKIHGNPYARRREKKSFRLHFKSEYGAKELHYSLLPGTTVQRFDPLLLRAGSQDGWSFDPQEFDPEDCDPADPDISRSKGILQHHRERALYVKNQTGYQLARDMGQPAPHGMFAEVYLTSEHAALESWGLYNALQTVNALFLNQHFGLTASWYVIKDGEFDGDLEAWQAWQEFVSRVEGLDLAVDEHYEMLLEDLDLEDFSRFVLLNVWLMNHDWPLHNWCAVRRREGDTRWRFILWDLDVTFGTTFYHQGIPFGQNYEIIQKLLRVYAPREGRENVISAIFRKLVDRDRNLGVHEYEDFFLSLYHRYAEVLSEDHVNRRLEEQLKQVAPVIEAEALRWGSGRGICWADDKTKGDWEMAAALTRDFVAWRSGIMACRIEKFFEDPSDPDDCTPLVMPTETPSATATPTSTKSPTPSPTSSETPTPSSTPSLSPTSTPTATPVPGDINGDRFVDAKDLFFFSLWWQESETDDNRSCNPVSEGPDDRIDEQDLLWLMRYWK